jgi:hypothetical protein
MQTMLRFRTMRWWPVCMLALVGARAAPAVRAPAFALQAPSAGSLATGDRAPLWSTARGRSGPVCGRKARSRTAGGAPQMLFGGADEAEMSLTGLGDLSVLGAFGKLRAGVPTKTRELPKPSRINESFEIQCEKASYLLKINRFCSAAQMFEGEAASQQVCSNAAGMCVFLPWPCAMGGNRDRRPNLQCARYRLGMSVLVSVGA